MQQTGVVFAVALAIVGVLAGGGAGCSVLLDTDTNPYKCTTSADCTRYPDAVCDTARKQCVARLPPVGFDAGVADGGGGTGGTGGLTCELAFDNRTRVPLDGPDGGLRPLPETP
jgi:hypothetical protein